MEVLDPADNFIRLQQGTRRELVKQATRTAADTYIVPLIMENKEVTKQLLREAGIRVPAGFAVDSISAAVELFPAFPGEGVVIKPKSTNFGKGITILKPGYSQDDYRNAVTEAFTYDTSVLIEEFITGKEYRFLIIGDEVPAVLHRVPANVRGDGVHTIRELVAMKNEDPLRGQGYVTPLEKIKLGAVEREYLGLSGRTVDDILEDGEIVYLRENSNISTGGDSIDVTDDMPESYKTIAIQAAQAVGAKICGADIIIRNMAEESNGPNYGVIELNFNPALHIHDFPYQGKNRQVEKKVLDILGF